MSPAEVIAEFRAAEEALSAARKKIEDIARPLIDVAFERGGEAEALKVVREIPCPVAGAFALDRIRYILPKRARNSGVVKES